jgi:hypothetical protein
VSSSNRRHIQSEPIKQDGSTLAKHAVRNNARSEYTNGANTTQPAIHEAVQLHGNTNFFQTQIHKDTQNITSENPGNAQTYNYGGSSPGIGWEHFFDDEFENNMSGLLLGSWEDMPVWPRLPFS